MSRTSEESTVDGPPPSFVTHDANLKEKSTVGEKVEEIIIPRLSVSQGKEEQQSYSVIQRIKSTVNICTHAQTQSDKHQTKESEESIDWSKINNCWEYMMHVGKDIESMDVTNQMVKEHMEEQTKDEEQIENEVIDATPSENICIECRLAAEQMILRHQGSGYVLTDFGTFPTKPASDRQLEVYDLFVLHLSTVPAVCVVCGETYGYCDSWVPKIISIRQIGIQRTMFCCLLCPFKNRRGYNAIVHAKDHLSTKGTGLECGKCAEGKKTESISGEDVGNHEGRETEDTISVTARHSGLTSDSGSEFQQITCKVCDKIMEETVVPPPTSISLKDGEQANPENSATSMMSLLFDTREITMARTQISKLKELERMRAASVHEELAPEDIALKVSRMVIFCEKCGNIFDLVENAITKLKEQEERIVSFFETIPEGERQFKCNIPHSTPLKEDILKESMITHLSYYQKICDKCQSENKFDVEVVEKREMYEVLVFDLSVLYSECSRCVKKFSLYDCSIPVIISVVESQKQYCYVCLLCLKTNQCTFDSIHHAAMHIASKYGDLLCAECKQLHEVAICEEFMQPEFSDRAPSYVAVRFSEAREKSVHCKNCGVVMGTLEDFVQMTIYQVMADTGEPSKTYSCHLCGRSDLTRGEVINHSEEHRVSHLALCEECIEASN